jgi:hypothetical protein
MGQRIRKSQRKHTRAKEKIENNEHHRAHEGNLGYEEVAVLIEDCADKEAIKISRTRTHSREINTNDCVARGGK